jgi:hypothetical protein
LTLSQFVPQQPNPLLESPASSQAILSTLEKK